MWSSPALRLMWTDAYRQAPETAVGSCQGSQIPFEDVCCSKLDFRYTSCRLLVLNICYYVRDSRLFPKLVKKRDGSLIRESPICHCSGWARTIWSLQLKPNGRQRLHSTMKANKESSGAASSMIDSAARVFMRCSATRSKSVSYKFPSPCIDILWRFSPLVLGERLFWFFGTIPGKSTIKGAV